MTKHQSKYIRKNNRDLATGYRAKQRATTTFFLDDRCVRLRTPGSHTLAALVSRLYTLLGTTHEMRHTVVFVHAYLLTIPISKLLYLEFLNLWDKLESLLHLFPPFLNNGDNM